MAEIVWTEPALSDLDTIADYIALENLSAAQRLVQKVLNHVEQLQEFPDSGSRPQELRGSRYRQLVELPCRVIYRHDASQATVYILHVLRSERKLWRKNLRRDP